MHNVYNIYILIHRAPRPPRRRAPEAPCRASGETQLALPIGGLTIRHFWVFCVSMIGRADIEGSKSNIATNAWLPQASYPCGNFSDIVSRAPMGCRRRALARIFTPDARAERPADVLARTPMRMFDANARCKPMKAEAKDLRPPRLIVWLFLDSIRTFTGFLAYKTPTNNYR